MGNKGADVRMGKELASLPTTPAFENLAPSHSQLCLQGHIFGMHLTCRHGRRS